MVNSQPSLHRSLAVDAQLRALALAADRANKPTSLPLFAAILIAAALMFMLLSTVGLASRRAELASAQTYAQEIDGLLDSIKQRQTSSIDLAKLYPRQPYLQVNILELVATLGLEFQTSPTVSLPRENPIIPRAGIYQSTVTCRLQTEPLDQILAWIDGILRFEPHQGKVFISQISLAPSGAGWQSTFEVSVYEHKKP